MHLWRYFQSSRKVTHALNVGHTTPLARAPNGVRKKQKKAQRVSILSLSIFLLSPFLSPSSSYPLPSIGLLILNSLASRTIRNKFLFYKLPSLCCNVVTAQHGPWQSSHPQSVTFWSPTTLGFRKLTKHHVDISGSHWNLKTMALESSTAWIKSQYSRSYLFILENHLTSQIPYLKWEWYCLWGWFC